VLAALMPKESISDQRHSYVYKLQHINIFHYAAKLLIGSTNVRGCENGTDLYHSAKYAGDLGSCAGCRRKNVMFFLIFFVMLWNDEVCDNRNAMMQCYFQNNYGHIA